MDKSDYTFEIVEDSALYTMYIADKDGVIIFKQCFLKSITSKTNIAFCAEAYITRMKMFDQSMSVGVECVKGWDLTL